jgi:hypothetical protein
MGKRRLQEVKVGRVKITLQLVKGIQRDIEEIKLAQRTILAGLKGMFHFEKPMIQKIACSDEVDEEILEFLYEAGNTGMLPKDLAVKLTQFGIRRHQVSRRILRMNRRVQKEIGETIVEKRGWHWSFTSFAFEFWGDEDAIESGENH